MTGACEAVGGVVAADAAGAKAATDTVSLRDPADARAEEAAGRLRWDGRGWEDICETEGGAVWLLLRARFGPGMREDELADAGSGSAASWWAPADVWVGEAVGRLLCGISGVSDTCEVVGAAIAADAAGAEAATETVSSLGPADARSEEAAGRLRWGGRRWEDACESVGVAAQELRSNSLLSLK